MANNELDLKRALDEARAEIARTKDRLESLEHTKRLYDTFRKIQPDAARNLASTKEHGAALATENEKLNAQLQLLQTEKTDLEKRLKTWEAFFRENGGKLDRQLSLLKKGLEPESQRNQELARAKTLLEQQLAEAAREIERKKIALDALKTGKEEIKLLDEELAGVAQRAKEAAEKETAARKELDATREQHKVELEKLRQEFAAREKANEEKHLAEIKRLKEAMAPPAVPPREAAPVEPLVFRGPGEEKGKAAAAAPRTPPRAAAPAAAPPPPAPAPSPGTARMRKRGPGS